MAQFPLPSEGSEIDVSGQLSWLRGLPRGMALLTPSPLTYLSWCFIFQTTSQFEFTDFLLALLASSSYSLLWNWDNMELGNRYFGELVRVINQLLLLSLRVLYDFHSLLAQNLAKWWPSLYKIWSVSEETCYKGNAKQCPEELVSDQLAKRILL